MPFNRVTNDIPGEPKQRVALDERFITQLLPESVQDRIEGQELRQILLACLQTLSPAEHRVIELRFQHKKSRGQVASQHEGPGLAPLARLGCSQEPRVPGARGRRNACHQGLGTPPVSGLAGRPGLEQGDARVRIDDARPGAVRHRHADCARTEGRRKAPRLGALRQQEEQFLCL